MAQSRNQGRKHRGYATQALIADDLVHTGLFPRATSTGAGRSGRDILHTPGWAIEVKATGSFSPLSFLRQASANADGDIPLCVHRNNSQGPQSLHEWPVVMYQSDLLSLRFHCDMSMECTTRKRFNVLTWIRSIRHDGIGHRILVAGIEMPGEQPEIAVVRWADMKGLIRATLASWNAGVSGNGRVSLPPSG